MIFLKNFFRPDIPIEKSENNHDSNYAYWRRRILVSITLGYAVFYFVRKNMSVANPILRDEFGIGKEEMGAVLGLAALIYGLSKFLSGLLSDTYSPRAIMATGLFISSCISILLGFTSESFANFLPFGSITTFFAIFWIANNVFQGMGQPPCSRLLTQWFAPSEIGKFWGIWNASHHIGGALILVIGGYLVTYFETWRSVFFAPGIFALIFSLYLLNRLRDRPEAVGLSSVEVYTKDITADEAAEEFSDKMTKKDIFVKYVLKNKFVWIVSLANLFIYIVRIGILDWAPSFLNESRGLSIAASANITAVFEVSGIAGAIAAGWLSDSVFAGRRGRVSVLFMSLLVLSIISILIIPMNSTLLMTLSLFAVGFFVHGPMLLAAVAAADFATKRAAATAVGLTGLFGYIGAFVANYGTGLIAERMSWDHVIYFYIISAFIGMVLLLTTWNSRSPLLDKHHSE